MPAQRESVLFRFDNVRVEYAGNVRAVWDVSFTGLRGQTVGVVGESGSGKSTLARAFLRLVPISQGKIELEGEDLSALSPRALRTRRRDFQMIFQDPDACLNPRRTALWHLREVLALHFPKLGEHDGEQRIEEVLEQVQLPEEILGRYSYELSGGQKQRLAIARALLLRPKLLLLDEPLSSLDASLRRSVLLLLRSLQEAHELTYLFITHDLSTLPMIAEHIVVMYRGTIVEQASTAELYNTPVHPYTKSLLSCLPIPDPSAERSRKPLLLPPHSPITRTGMSCPFAHRCPHASGICREEPPALRTLTGTHAVACHRTDLREGANE